MGGMMHKRQCVIQTGCRASGRKSVKLDGAISNI